MKRDRESDTVTSSPTTSSPQEVCSNYEVPETHMRKRDNDGDKFVDSIELALSDAIGMFNRLADRRLIAKRDGVALPCTVGEDKVQEIIENACIKASLLPNGAPHMLPLLEALYIGVMPST